MSGMRVGTVVGNTSPQEYRFFLRGFSAKLGDLVYVETDVPKARTTEREPPKEKVLVWGRIVELTRFNPFLPAEAGQELAEEELKLKDTVLSLSRDHVEGKVLVLGMTYPNDFTRMRPLNYPVSPGETVVLPPAETVKTILTGNEEGHRLRLGSLIGRPNVEVTIKTNALVARHMAILAMTGGGKTVAVRRIIRELLTAGYPLLILDPHGDYLGVYTRRDVFSGRTVRLFFPSVGVNEYNRDLVGYLVSRMTQGFTDPQKDEYQEAAEKVTLRADRDTPIGLFIDLVIQKLDERRTAGGTVLRTLSAVKRGLRLVAQYMEAMEKSNERLRSRESLKEFPFEPMPDPKTSPADFVRPNQASILYLGGYDHLTQSTIAAIVLKELFDHRASMSNAISPFLAVVEEAHNFIPSHGEGQADTPSVEVIRKIITEGRKFGTGLLLVSQRPSRLDETALSQCNTFLIFRLVNPRDQSFVEKVMENLSKDDSRLLPGFGPGQGIVSGQAVRFPLLVQVDYDADLETRAIGDENFVDAAVQWNSAPQALAASRSQAMIADLEDDGAAPSAR
jgi:DNA helicase HerA-like ATPase